VGGGYGDAVDYATYLAQLRADGLRIGSRARQTGALGADVPDCPGWTLADLVGHLGRIYRFVLAALATGQAPVEGGYEQIAPRGVELVDWFDAGHRSLLARLEGTSPPAATWTWWPADQSVAFWARRMCHETLVHRLDADGALEFHAGVTAELALDGVDEVLTRFVGRSELSKTRTTGVPVSADIVSGGRRWRVVVDQDVVAVGTAKGVADAEIAGAPLDMLRWSWGRPPYGAVATSGNAASLDLVRAVVVEAAG
jgi:uncharacterized protein (TIGR03083 family)